MRKASYFVINLKGLAMDSVGALERYLLAIAEDNAEGNPVMVMAPVGSPEHVNALILGSSLDIVVKGI